MIIFVWQKFLFDTIDPFHEDRETCNSIGNWGPWIVVKEPTATEPGIKERYCQQTQGDWKCKGKQTDIIPALGIPEVVVVYRSLGREICVFIHEN